MSTPAAEPELLRRFIEHHVAYLRCAKAGRRLAESQRPDIDLGDRFDGGGIFALYAYLSGPARVLALCPWAIGILFALAGRVLGQLLTDRDALVQFDKIQSLDLLLLAPPETPGLAASVMSIVRNEGQLRERLDRLNRLNYMTEVCSWLAHISFGVGVVIVAILMALK